MSSKKSPRAMALLAALALAGCGKAEKAPTAAVKQFVVTSAVDCAENAGLEYEACSTLIETAVATHTKDAPTFTSTKACEKSEGAGKCERVDETTYRPRLTAFQLTMSEPPTAAPLYPSKKPEAGFRTAGNTAIVVDNEAYTFTKSAADASELFMGKKRGLF